MGHLVILDEFGQPAQQGNRRLKTPEWVVEKLARVLRPSLIASQRFVTLFGPDDRPVTLPPKDGVGDTVHVRLPRRFTLPK